MLGLKCDENKVWEQTLMCKYKGAENVFSKIF
jgi:hypothetical protein